MATKKRGLGRGLDALLGGAAKPAPVAPVPAAAAHDTVGEPADGSLRKLPVDLIQRGKYQPRHDMHQESLQDLADSIKAQGVVQPIVVRPIGPGTGTGNQVRYEIIAGERRWRAAQLAGLQDIPAVVRDVPDRAAIAMALIENIQRENLNPLEESRALHRLIREFALTHQEAAEAVGRSRAAVSNLLRLLELTEDVKELVEAGKLEMGHARALLALAGAVQTQTARQIVAKGLSVRETERLVKRLLADAGRPPRPVKAVDPDVRRLEQELADRLGAKVVLEQARGGKGRLVISYNSLDELDGILEKIREP